MTLKLDDLRIRTGIYATVFVVRGHVNDTTQSSMHGTDNSDDFWEDVYDLPMADFLRQYEQWACTQNQSKLSVSAHILCSYLLTVLQILTNATLWKQCESKFENLLSVDWVCGSIRCDAQLLSNLLTFSQLQ